MIASAHRVFVSYTGKDLEGHADAVASVVRKLQWVAIDHKDWSPNDRPSVSECKKNVESCQILVVLIAHRYGWVPSTEEGGDGRKSITWLEYEHARAKGLEVIPFIVEEDAPWPADLIEALENPVSLEPLKSFKQTVGSRLAGFFSDPRSLEGSTVAIALNRAAEQLAGPAMKSDSAPADEETNEDLIVPMYWDSSRPPSLNERLETQLPKRILSMDGAGVRTGIIFGFLERIEQLLQIRYGSAEIRLSDYFDLIGGTGPAALVATELACGKQVAEVKPLFRQGVKAILSQRRMLFAPLSRSFYKDSKLRNFLEETFEDRTIEDEALRTGLCIITTRLDDGATLSFTNHPGDSDKPRLLLRDLVLASTSLPTFLPPVKVDLGETHPAFLVSGDASIGPDPALYLFMLCTSNRFPFQWRTGRRRLFLLSLGGAEGHAPERKPGVEKRSTLMLLPQFMNLMIQGLRQQSQSLLQTLTFEPDDETTTLTREMTKNPQAEPILSYRRFDVRLAEEWFKENNLEKFVDKIDRLRRLDDINSLEDHFAVGQAVAKNRVDDFFLPSFDVRRPVSPDTSDPQQ